MPLFRKTALVEATQWFKHGDHDAVQKIPPFHHEHAGRDDLGWVPTLEGGHVVTPGDWIAGPGAKGEFWPIKPEVFQATYEPANAA
ncbi:MAG: hypothetical protein RJA36_1469 [Pseudomonadota bacterium]|jgi:hypothetical protein